MPRRRVGHAGSRYVTRRRDRSPRIAGTDLGNLNFRGLTRRPKRYDWHGNRDYPLLAAQNRAQEYARLCLRACVVGLGGSSPTGCLGYASCAREILAQQAQLGIDFDSIVVASGSAGTHAGLLAGLIASDVDNIEVIDFSVLARAPAIGDNTRALVTETLKRLGHSGDFPSEKVVVDDSQLGESYGIPTPMMMDAVRTLARTEGLLLDPVYSGKAFAGLIEAIRSWKWAPGASVLFVMTGGAPGLFAYRTALACM